MSELGTLAIVGSVTIAIACGGAVDGETSMGEPCTPSVQSAATFSGFDVDSVVVERGAKACPSQICLVNHFRGKVGLPYGDGTVAPQCVDRAAKAAVYCSCRCANNGGRTDDGGTYCACAPGFTCTPLVTSIGPSSDDVSGSYCIKNGTEYDRATACATNCDALSSPCQ